MKFIDASSSSSTTDEDSDSKKVHYVPFKVDYEGPAKVEVLFTQKAVPSEKEENVLKNHFRGRPLQGTDINLPEGYKGFIAKKMEETKLKTEDASNVTITDKFEKMTYWEWDKPPSSMDGIVKLKDWLAVGEVVHAPIDPN